MFDSPKAYAVKHLKEDVRASSRSGGIFTALSDYLLENAGAVYGCVMDDNFSAKHIRAVSREERDRMRGSKYIQSDMGMIFQEVRKDLEQEIPVLFTGTSCQIAGLKGFLRKDYPNLLCVDIVCHGVPSKKLFHKYLTWMEKRYKAKCKNFDFRNKTDFGWAAHTETLYFKNGKKVNSEIFRTLFYGHNILRPACYQCPYKSVKHPGDITIADFWGIDKAVPGFNDNKGVSLVLVNNEKGEQMLDLVKDVLLMHEAKLEDCIQPPLKAPFQKPDERERFWQDFAERDFGYIAKKYAEYSFAMRLRKCVRKCKKKIKEMLKV